MAEGNEKKKKKGEEREINTSAFVAILLPNYNSR